MNMLAETESQQLFYDLSGIVAGVGFKQNKIRFHCHVPAVILKGWGLHGTLPRILLLGNRHFNCGQNYRIVA